MSEATDAAILVARPRVEAALTPSPGAAALRRRHNSWFRNAIARLAAASAAAVAAAASAWGAPAAPAPSITVRPTNDGAGPSLLLIQGSWLIVVDPRDGLIRRYPKDGFGKPAAPVAQCRFDRTFSPWRTVVDAEGITLVDEDDDRAMRLRPTDVAAWGASSTCPIPASGVRAPPPRLDRITVGRRALTVPAALRGGRPLLIDAGRFGETLGAKLIGKLPGDRRAVLWKRLERLPRAGERPSDGRPYDLQGRVVVSLLVTIFRRDGSLQATLRLKDFAVAGPALSWDPGIDVQGMHKRAFEFAVADGDASGDWLYVLRDRDGVFQVERYPLPSASSPDSAAVEVVSLIDGASPEPSEGADGDPDETVPVGRDVVRRREAWDAELQRRVDAYTKGLAWRVPQGMTRRPCANGADECVVMIDAGGRIVERGADRDLPAGFTAIRQDHDGDRAMWKRPTQLRGLPAGATVVGMPYSFSGDDTPEGFASVVNGSAPDPLDRPIGHIRTTLVVLNGAGRAETLDHDLYPLGIDCSRFVAHILGATAIPTGGVVDTEHGRLNTPGGAFALPVEHPSRLRPGDLLVKNGHIVIYRRTVFIGLRGTTAASATYASRHGAIGYEVYEASSRCGRACRSVYELDFFNGWWMFRPMRMSTPHGPAIANPYGPPVWVSAPAPAGLATTG